MNASTLSAVSATAVTSSTPLSVASTTALLKIITDAAAVANTLPRISCSPAITAGPSAVRTSAATVEDNQ